MKQTNSQTTKTSVSKKKTGKRFIPDILTPNMISVIRLIMVPLFVFFFYFGDEEMKIVAACIFALAAVTDFLDGYIARKYNKVTTIGKFLDPIADKVLVSTALIVLLTHNEFMTEIIEDAGDWMPVLMGVCVAVIIARELIISVFREIAAEKKTVLAAGMLGKVKTFVQDIAIIMLIIAIALREMWFPTATLVTFIIGMVIFGFATALTVASGVEYVVMNQKVLKNNQ